MLSRRSALSLTAALAVGSFLFSHPIAVAGPETAGQVICYAKVDGDGSLFATGGKGTKTVDVAYDSNNPGSYIVTCNGKYPPNGHATRLVINATPGGTEARLIQARPFGAYTPTQFAVVIETVHPGTLQQADSTFYVAIFIGK